MARINFLKGHHTYHNGLTLLLDRSPSVFRTIFFFYLPLWILVVSFVVWESRHQHGTIDMEIKLEMVWPNLMKYSCIKVWTYKVCHLEEEENPTNKCVGRSQNECGSDWNECSNPKKEILSFFLLVKLHSLRHRNMSLRWTVLLSKCSIFDSFLSFDGWLRTRKGIAAEPNNKKLP